MITGRIIKLIPRNPVIVTVSLVADAEVAKCQSYLGQN